MKRLAEIAGHLTRRVKFGMAFRASRQGQDLRCEAAGCEFRILGADSAERRNERHGPLLPVCIKNIRRSEFKKKKPSPKAIGSH